MKKLKLIFALGLSPFLSFGQIGEYTLRKERTKEIIGGYQHYSFEVLKVQKKELSIPVYREIKTETDEFKREKERYDKLLNDSTVKANEYSVKYEKYNHIQSALEKINEFLSSSESFDNKSNLLIQAQEVLDNYYNDVLLYADKEIKPDKRRDFNTLKRNQNEFSQYLRKTYNNIRANNSNPTNESKFFSRDLKSSREIMGNMKQHNITYEKTGSFRTEVGYIVLEEVKQLETIEGNFKLIDKFYHVEQATTDYLYNQVIPKERMEKSVKYDTRIKYYPMFMNSETNEHYLDKGGVNIFYEAGENKEVTDILNKLKSLGYKVSDQRGNYIIHTEKTPLTLTYDIMKEVNSGNTDYISEIANSIVEFNKTVMESKSLMTNLAKHFNAYRYGTLTSDRFDEWRSDVKKADNLNNKVNSLKGREDANLFYYQKHLSIETISQYNDFREVLLGSKEILGI